MAADKKNKPTESTDSSESTVPTDSSDTSTSASASDSSSLGLWAKRMKKGK